MGATNLAELPANVDGRPGGQVAIRAEAGVIRLTVDRPKRGSEPAARMVADLTPNQAVVLKATLGAAGDDAKRQRR